MNSKPTSSLGVLAVGGVAAVLASSCCLGPLILVMMGFSGAWIGSLSALEPYRPLFLGFTLIALLLAGFHIFRRAKDCDVDGTCSTPRTRRIQKFTFSVVALLAIVAFAFPYLARFFY
ncbi:mercuric ion transporter MerT [Edaphobacter modestus]|uniref:Mercuric transport protein MerT n=1 Tax=Edaphobacter modestus TaxID=388466 RepID=A0A4V2G563_9BACT|nr:mercuric ion transporter MerT [Edaphobacter modestus]RZU43696.1 mercuric ion transport protein [Edaphobacter modestus]